MEHYIDDEGNVIVSKSIRPIIEYPETFLGSKRGARRQFRYGNLHIREYDEYYTTHMDKIDPREDPLGHLMIDAPEYLVGLFWALSIARHVASSSGKGRKEETPDLLKTLESTLCNDSLPGCIIGLVLATASFIGGNFIKNWIANNLKS
jgi:hypothetical protein